MLSIPFQPASKKNKLNSRQRVIRIVSACHLSNGCLKSHMVANGGLVSAKWEQCIDNARYPRSKPLSGMGGGDMAEL